MSFRVAVIFDIDSGPEPMFIAVGFAMRVRVGPTIFTVVVFSMPRL